ASDSRSLERLEQAIAFGCNFFDTAWIYGRGHSEVLLGQLMRQLSGVAVSSVWCFGRIPP
ncbi:MAG: aldo/keto reductase, partial [Opitutaceae bacterium]